MTTLILMSTRWLISLKIKRWLSLKNLTDMQIKNNTTKNINSLKLIKLMSSYCVLSAGETLGETM